MKRKCPIGQPGDFPQLPAPITIEKAPYFLIREKGKWKLLSAICPHTGGMICADEAGFECPHHGWLFSNNGSCLTEDGRPMKSYKVVEKNGQLFALM